VKKYIALMLMLGCGTAAAAPVTWALNDVTFDDGSTASGQFTYDAVTGNYSSINIHMDYVNASDWDFLKDFLTCQSGLPCEDLFLIGARAVDWIAGYSLDQLALNFDSALTDSGGVKAILPSSNFIQCQTYGFYCSLNDPNNFYIHDYGYVVSGTVTAVPVPAAVWLFSSSLAGLFWFRRKHV
jgi:hypothetical protein